MGFGSLDGREAGKYNGVAFVEISQIFVMQDLIYFGRVYHLIECGNGRWCYRYQSLNVNKAELHCIVYP